MATTEIILIVLTIAGLVLLVFLIRLIIAATKTLVRLNRTLSTVQKQLDSIGHEPKQILHQVNAIAQDVHQKMQSIDPIFRAVSNLGEGLEDKTYHFKQNVASNQLKKKLVSSEPDQEDYLKAFTDLSILGIKLWNKFKKRS